MPWLVGIDEAGYGPNLGPLVQTAVLVRASDDQCLWQKLAACVCRAVDCDETRLIVDDSKSIYPNPNGLALLERGVAAMLRLNLSKPFQQIVDRFGCSETRRCLPFEPWYDADESGPVADDIANLRKAAKSISAALETANIEIKVAGLVLTPTPRFNQLLDHHDSKAGPLGDGLVSLLKTVGGLRRNGKLTIFVDKQGGRNFYAAMIQAAFPDDWVHCLIESAQRSEYLIERDDGNIRFIFAPRAEAESMAVALASMLAKYLRERCMRQFNRYWQRQVPGLAPTAGYPGDAKRYYDAIRPAMDRLGFAPDMIWRRR